MGSAHPNLVPYRAFEANDGWFVIAVGSDPQWEKLVSALQIEDAIDSTWSTNSGRISARAEVEALISSKVANFSRDELVSLLAGIPNSPVNTISEALADPQSIARGILTEYNGVSVLSSPLRSLDN